MPKYKSGDIAASLPQPKAEPTTESGKKLQSLFNEFYFIDKTKNSFQSKKNIQRENEEPVTKTFQIEKECSGSANSVKSKKRKLSQLSEPEIEDGFIKKEKKVNSNSISEDFPRSKKFKRNETFNKLSNTDFYTINQDERRKISQNFKHGQKLQARNKHHIFDESHSEISVEDTKVNNKKRNKHHKFEESQSEIPVGDAKIHNKKHVNPVPKKKDSIVESSDKNMNKSFKSKHQNRGHFGGSQLEISNKRNKKKFKKQNIAESKNFASSQKNSLFSENKDSEFKMKLSKDDFIALPTTKKEDCPEKTERTLFIGNLPINIKNKDFKKLFTSFGPLESIRLRGAIPMKESIPKKVAGIKREYHKGIHSLRGYVAFKDKKDALQALALNGTLFHGHHILVDSATVSSQKKKYDDKRAIFIGNLPFDVDDETIWSMFSQCGKVDGVRIVRDGDTGVGKGFGYVAFDTADSKDNALKLEHMEINGRNIRIKPIESKTNQEKKRFSPKVQFNSYKSKALRIKKKTENSSSRKSTKKIMNKQKALHKKKQIANILQKKSR